MTRLAAGLVAVLMGCGVEQAPEPPCPDAGHVDDKPFCTTEARSDCTMPACPSQWNARIKGGAQFPQILETIQCGTTHLEIAAIEGCLSRPVIYDVLDHSAYRPWPFQYGALNDSDVICDFWMNVPASGWPFNFGRGPGQ